MNTEKMGLDMQSKSKVLSLMQPTYFPWLGYFNLINQSDVFIIYDDVQLTKRSWQVRNKIKNNNDELLLTIPVKKTRHRDELLIMDAEVEHSSKWINKHLNSIKNSYKKTPYFDLIFPIIENRLNTHSQHLTDITTNLIKDFVKLLNIDTEIIESKNIKYNGKKDEALISICQNLEIKRYLSVKGSQDYILEGKNLFEKNNIELLWHEYSHPTYNQIGEKFISHLGIIDPLFNIGPEETKKLI